MVADPPICSPDADPEMILTRMTDGFFALDTSYHITYANEKGTKILEAGMPDDEPVEHQHLWDSMPGSRETVFYERFTEAMEQQRPISFESQYEPLETWFEVRVFPSESGLSVYFRDISEEKRLQQERHESLHALKQLYAVSSDRARDFETKTQDLLDLGCEYLDLSNGFLTNIEQGVQYIEQSVATHPAVQEGETCPLEEAYCKRTLELDQLLTVVNASDEGWTEDPAYDRFGFETYIGGRVVVDDELYGTLCFADTDEQERGFTDTQRTFVELLTRWVGYELERAAATEQVTRERDRLDEFTKAVSHDLRNPLNTASGRLELLAAETDSEHVAPIRRSLNRMEQLIEDLLTLAREGMKVEDPTPIPVAEPAQAAWRTVETDAAELQITVDDLVILADESRLRQAFENLFRNAAEHGGDDVTVTVGGLDEEPGLYVADDGPGVPTAEQERLFDPGYATTNEGTGFGLNIVEDIVTAHGWEIRLVDSDSGGARFEITGVEFVSASTGA